MRRTLIGIAAAGALLVAGCGGDDDDSGTEANEGGDTQAFCEQFQSYDQQFSETEDASEDEIIRAIQSLDPPDEIREDYDTLLQGLTELSVGASTTIDTSDPAAAQEMQDRVNEYTQASSNIQDFLEANC
jgi:hypothetical protein